MFDWVTIRFWGPPTNSCLDGIFRSAQTLAASDVFGELIFDGKGGGERERERERERIENCDCKEKPIKKHLGGNCINKGFRKGEIKV